MEELSNGNFYTSAERKGTPALVAEIIDTMRDLVRSLYGDVDGEGTFKDLRSVLKEHFEKLIADNQGAVMHAVQLAVGNYSEIIGIGGMDVKIGVYRKPDQKKLLRSDEDDFPSVCIFQPYAGHELAKIEFDIKRNREVTMVDGLLSRSCNLPGAWLLDSNASFAVPRA